MKEVVEAKGVKRSLAISLLRLSQWSYPIGLIHTEV
jgi:hypothetical protein